MPGKKSKMRGAHRGTDSASRTPSRDLKKYLRPLPIESAHDGELFSETDRVRTQSPDSRLTRLSPSFGLPRFLAFRKDSAGISLSAPRKLAPPFHRLPAMLRHLSYSPKPTGGHRRPLHLRRKNDVKLVEPNARCSRQKPIYKMKLIPLC